MAKKTKIGKSSTPTNVYAYCLHLDDVIDQSSRFRVSKFFGILDYNTSL